MKLDILKKCKIHGKSYKKGDVAENVDPRKAARLIKQGYAKAFEVKPKE